MKISICLFILLLAAGEVILDMEISVLTHFVKVRIDRLLSATKKKCLYIKFAINLKSYNAIINI